MMLDPEALNYYAVHPIEFVEDVIKVTPDDNQRMILQSVNDNTLTSVRSGHGVGKSAVASWCIIWFILTRLYPKIPCTAPTKHQLYDILWAEISKWTRSNPLLNELLVWTHEKFYLRGHQEEWFAVPRTATTPDALQGFHADDILYIIDEASGVDDEIFESILGALSTEGAKALLLGNPTKISGFFYDSHHKNRTMFNAIHIDGRSSGRVDAKFVQTVITMYGEDSDVFRVRVAGEFPKALPDSFIPLEWAERASEGDADPIDRPQRVDIGVDVARYGDDTSVLCPVLDRSVQEKPDIYHHNDIMEIAGHTVQMIKRYARLYLYASIHVKVDCDGLGVGTHDRLVEIREQIVEEVEAERQSERENSVATDDTTDDIPPFVLQIVECHFGGKGGTISDDEPIDFANSTGLMWGAIREALRNNSLRLWKDDRQISQLSNRRYKVNSDGKIELERKEAMKKRGLVSPDIADALALAMHNPQVSDWTID